MKRNNESLKVILLTVLTAAGFAGGALAAEGRKLLWSDEFNGPQLDTNIWRRIDRGTSDWNRHMSTRADLLEMRDGCVVLVGQVDMSTLPVRMWIDWLRVYE